MFPALVSYKMDGVLLNTPIYWRDPSRAEVNHGSPAVIAPFAQSDTISLFVEGAAAEYESFVEEYFGGFVSGIGRFFDRRRNHDDATRKQAEAKLQRVRRVASGDAACELEEKRHELYVQPMLSAVGALPLDELAALAESLVNLASLRKRVSMSHEDVGGPIDVAVISAGRRSDLDQTKTLFWERA